MKKYLKNIIASLAVMLAMSLPALSQAFPSHMPINPSNCSTYENVSNALSEGGKEEKIFTDIADEFGTVGVELYVNFDKNTWTILNIYGNGMACIILSGSNFDGNEIKKEGDKL